MLAWGLLVLACTSSKTGNPVSQPQPVVTKPFGEGSPAKIHFVAGEAYNHPLIVFWVEDMQGRYIETIYVSKSIATGIFRYGVNDKGKWREGERRRPAALPYWSHKRGVRSADGLLVPKPDEPLPDAVTGATPTGSFTLNTNLPGTPRQFRLLMEINQTWDWNNYWHNNRFPDDEEYKTSCQPALVYAVDIDLGKGSGRLELKPIGHSHYSGRTGELFPDISTLTTALRIADAVFVELQ
jgi:hypothetical protein